MNQPENQTFSCGECQAGHLRRAYVTYFTWLGEDLVTVPNFPAWVCDVCGKREYDERAVNWLTTLLSPQAGKPTLQRKPRHRLPSIKREQNRPLSTE